jgi:hypothetical protein
LAFARHQFEINQPLKDGTTPREHLLTVWEKTGEIPAALRDAPPLPLGCEALWDKFQELHKSRGSTGWGAQRITHLDLFAFQHNRSVRFSDRELDLIQKTDDVWLAEFAPKPKETT